MPQGWGDLLHATERVHAQFGPFQIPWVQVTGQYFQPGRIGNRPHMPVPQDFEAVGLLPAGTACRPSSQGFSRSWDEGREYVMIDALPELTVSKESAYGYGEQALAASFLSRISFHRLQIRLQVWTTQLVHVTVDALPDPLSDLAVASPRIP